MIKEYKRMPGRKLGMVELSSGGRTAEIVRLGKRGSGLSRAEAWRRSYLRMAERRDGRAARNELERRFKTHPLDDPVAFARKMQEKAVLGIYADSDGTLIVNREGYDSAHLFSPRLGKAIEGAVRTTGLFTIASAAHIRRAQYLLGKAGGQVPLERLLFFAENGYAVLMPSRTRRGHEFELHKAVMPSFVHERNREVASTLDHLSETALSKGLFMFVNQDKEAKITLELKANGKESNNDILRKLVAPVLAKELGAEWSAAGDDLIVSLPPVKYRLIPTGSSIEIDHDHLPSKWTVNAIMKRTMIDLWRSSIGDGALKDVEKVFVGFGDSPHGSDEGLVDHRGGNIGFSVPDRPRKLVTGERVIDVMRKSADPPLVTLPVFSKDGGIQLGDGEAVAANLERLMFAGNFFKVREIEDMRKVLRKVLKESGYVPEATLRDEKRSMYTLPSYLAERADVDGLMHQFLAANTPEKDMAEKLCVTATSLSIT